jgi:ADP-dependent NAD(P)H-hydrate dehydratase / NAD(P)H-hydrate epimerase
MLIIMGTIPVKNAPLIQGYCTFQDGILSIGEKQLPLINGTSVVLASALTICKALNIEAPYAVVAGDIGDGSGSNHIYRFLQNSPLNFAPKNSNVTAISYLKPNILYAKEAIKNLKKHLNTLLIADSGAMYVAKAAGIACEFDLFTPDFGEMAFLADPEAVHPAYTRNYIFENANNVPKLIKEAYTNKNVARCLIVKGAIDYIVEDGNIVAQISKPCIPALEPIGGTGDSLMGIASVLVSLGHKVADASVLAAKTNRLMGELYAPNPSTKVWEMLNCIPKAIQLAGFVHENGHINKSNSNY